MFLAVVGGRIFFRRPVVKPALSSVTYPGISGAVRINKQRLITEKKQRDAFESVKRANAAKRARLLAEAQLKNIRSNEVTRAARKQTVRARRLSSAAGERAIGLAVEKKQRAVRTAVKENREVRRLTREAEKESIILAAVKVQVKEEKKELKLEIKRASKVLGRLFRPKGQIRRWFGFTGVN